MPFSTGDDNDWIDGDGAIVKPVLDNSNFRPQYNNSSGNTIQFPQSIFSINDTFQYSIERFDKESNINDPQFSFVANCGRLLCKNTIYTDYYYS